MHGHRNRMERYASAGTLSLGLLVASLSVLSGCRSQLGTVYEVATGKTTAADVLPQRPTPTAGQPTMAASQEAPVGHANFAPPALPGAPPQPMQTSTATAPSNTPAGLTHAVGRNPLPEPTREQAMDAVLGDLQLLSRENPAAMQELLRRMESTPPGEWQALARRMHADLAVNRSLHQSPAPDYPSFIPPTAIASQTAAPARTQPWDQAQREPIRTSMASFEPPPIATPPTMPHRAVTSSPDALFTNPERRSPPAYQQQPVVDPAPVPLPPVTPEQAPHSWDTGSHQPTNRIQLASAEQAVGQAPQPQVIANPYRDDLPSRSHLNAPGDWRAHLAAAITELEASNIEQPVNIAEAYTHARLRLMRLASGALDSAVEPIPGLTPTEQDYWSSQLFALSTMLDHDSHPEAQRRAAAAEIHLARAHAQVKQLATLAVRSMTFCTGEVTSYGAYTPRANRRFKAGDEVTLYVEVENFANDQRGDRYHTILSSSCRVLDSRDAQVSSQEYPAFEDICLSPRRDFFMQYNVKIPDRIYPGEYHLEFTLTDQISSKIGRASIDFEIVE